MPKNMNKNPVKKQKPVRAAATKARTLNQEIQTAGEILKAAGKSRSALMKHKGERGRNNEDELKKTLRKFLPQKMFLGTGVIECSDPAYGQSNQQDIIIYDGLNNTPLVEFDNTAIYPIEAVYGMIEVKTTLTRALLKESFVANRKIRDMAEKSGKHYWFPATGKDENGKLFAVRASVTETLPPRFFLFVYSAGKTKLKTIEKWFQDLSLETNAHCHGLCILDQDCYLARHPYDKPQLLFTAEKNGFSVFLNRLRSSLSTMNIMQMEWQRYMLEPN